MYALTIFLTILGAGALAYPHPSSPLKYPRGTGRTGHTAWIASFGVDDHDCSGPWLNGTKGDSDVTRPTLTWDLSGQISKKFAVLDDTNNVGIYFGNHRNHLNYVYLYYNNDQNYTQVNATHDGSIACISASANNYPWTSVEGSS